MSFLRARSPKFSFSSEVAQDAVGPSNGLALLLTIVKTNDLHSSAVDGGDPQRQVHGERRYEVQHYMLICSLDVHVLYALSTHCKGFEAKLSMIGV